jgi:hypothetical protein
MRELAKGKSPAFVSILIIAGGLIAWLSYRFFVIVPTGDLAKDDPSTLNSSSRPVGTAPRLNLTNEEIAEMGEYATSPRFQKVLITYLNDLKKYEDTGTQRLCLNPLFRRLSGG